MKTVSQNRRCAFSLVEVTLALGLISFCLLALLGLLPIGLNSMRAAECEAGAVNCLEQLSGAIRGAVLDETQTGTYKASGGYANQNLTWKLGGSGTTANLSNLSISGFPSEIANEHQFVAHIEVTPPADALTAGTAVISVAWPFRATWDGSKNDWQNAQGTVHTVLVFLPNQ